MRRIAFLADWFLLDPTTPVTGSHVQMFNLARAFAGRGLKVHYLCQTRGRTEGEEEIHGLKVHFLAAGRGVLSWVRDLRSYQRLLDLIGPDVVYQRGRSHLTYAAASWAKNNGKLFVWGSNGEDSCDFWKLTGLLKRSSRPVWQKAVLFPVMAAQDLLIHRGVRGAGRVVNQTEYQRARLWEHYRKPGVTLPSYFLPPPEKALEKEKTVLWLANLSPGKQPELFLRLAEACGDNREWTFVLAGGTGNEAYFERLSRQAAALPNVQMVGAVPFEETDRYFGRAALFANTSRHEAEGLPNTFIQAWFHQTPVLSLNHDPNGWIGRHKLGFCAHGDLDLWVKTGQALLSKEEELRDMGEAAARFARETFAADRTIDVYLEIFAGRGFSPEGAPPKGISV